MTYQEKYKKAKESGYSDQDIMEYLGTKDPEFEGKVMKAQEAGYTPQEVLHYFNASPVTKPEESPDSAEDFVKQGAQGFGIGVLGTYGDILDFLGLQTQGPLPGEKAKYDREFNVLDKIEKGERPSIGELMELSSEEEIAPRSFRLPTTKNIEEVGSKIGLVSEPKTAAGRYARRIGRLGGGAASLGGRSVRAPIAAGSAGQTAEELGFPPWVQAVFE